MYDVSPIKDYINFLIEELELSISIHTIPYNSFIKDSVLRKFSIHQNSYCICLKNSHDASCHCVKKQAKVFEKCKSGSYIGTCYAGVTEFIYPIVSKEKTIGFISVSGYKSENAESYLAKVSSEYSLPLKELEKTYSLLKDEIPCKSKIDTLIHPLCAMLQLACEKAEEMPADAEMTFARKIERYIIEHHNSDISSEDICRQLGCNRSYMSSEFNKSKGKSIREFINELRIDDAKSLLKHSRLSITEIAYSVGFTDSNYFSYIFKKSVGVSPMQYRKNKVQKDF